MERRIACHWEAGASLVLFQLFVVLSLRFGACLPLLAAWDLHSMTSHSKVSTYQCSDYSSDADEINVRKGSCLFTT